MTRSEAREQFRHIYPEREIYINSIKDLGNNKFLLEAKFPEAIFYFIIEENIVSNSYDTEEQAKRSVNAGKKKRLIAFTNLDIAKENGWTNSGNGDLKKYWFDLILIDKDGNEIPKEEKATYDKWNNEVVKTLNYINDDFKREVQKVDFSKYFEGDINEVNVSVSINDKHIFIQPTFTFVSKPNENLNIVKDELNKIFDKLINDKINQINYNDDTIKEWKLTKIGKLNKIMKKLRKTNS